MQISAQQVCPRTTGDRLEKKDRVAPDALTQYDNGYHSRFCAPVLKQDLANSIELIAVAGPPGSGKTTWIGQFLQDQDRPLFYCCPGMGDGSVDLVRIAHHFPWVHLIPESQAPTILTELPDRALVYLELGFHLDLASPFLTLLPWRKVAVLPPKLNASDWHDWADETISGSDSKTIAPDNAPELWRAPLTGRVFDPPSLDEILSEVANGAYGSVHRIKGIFELPDGRAFDVDLAAGLPGIEYTELKLPRWLEGRPTRFSGIEVVGWDLQQKDVGQALRDGCLSDEALAQYQAHYKAQISHETSPEERILT